MPITAPSRALDPRPVRVAIIATLLANGGVAALVGTRIYPDDDVGGGVFPYLTVSMPSAVPNYLSSASILNSLFDIIAVDKSTGTRAVDSIGYAAQQALVDAVWTVSGYTMVGREVVGIRTYTDEVDGLTYRYAATTLRVLVEKN